jgi:hypothetical protein
VANGALYKLPDLTIEFFIGSFIKILISSTILYLTVKLVGGGANFKKSIFLAAFMEIISVILPLFANGLLYLVLHVIIWLFLVMTFFKVPPWKAVLIALLQGVVAFALTLISILSIIGTIISALFLIK